MDYERGRNIKSFNLIYFRIFCYNYLFWLILIYPFFIESYLISIDTLNCYKLHLFIFNKSIEFVLF